MFAHHRIVFPQDKLLGHGPGVFLGDIEKSRSSSGIEPDFDGCRLGHWYLHKAAKTLAASRETTNQTRYVKAAAVIFIHPASQPTPGLLGG
jgi:hypothetical protein